MKVKPSFSCPMYKIKPLIFLPICSLTPPNRENGIERERVSFQRFFIPSSQDQQQKGDQDPISIMENLPPEITANILSFLPVKSVFQCRSVCKSWRSVIDNPNFRNLHNLNSSSSSAEPDHGSPLMFIPYNYQGEMVLLQNYDVVSAPISICKSSKINIAFYHRSLFCKVSCCKGLFLFNGSGSSPPHMSVCNPITREYVTLPPLDPEDQDYYDSASGFGFDPLSGKFKVIHIVHHDPDEEANETRASHVQVCTPGSRSWKTLVEPPPRYVSDISHAYVNDCVHWISGKAVDYMDDQDYPVSHHIVSFDFRSEKFGLVLVPELCCITNGASPKSAGVILGLLGGCLCLSDCYDDFYEIWVMREYNVAGSWTKQFVIAKNMLTHSVKDFSSFDVYPISFGKSGQQELLLCDSKLLVSYNLETGRAMPLLDGRILQLLYKARHSLFEAFPYVGSLIPPVSL